MAFDGPGNVEVCTGLERWKGFDRGLPIEELNAGGGLVDKRRVLEQTADSLVRQVDADGSVAGDDVNIIDDNFDHDGSACGQVVEKFLVHPDVCLLRRSGRPIVLKATPQVISFANIVSAGRVVAKSEAVKPRLPGSRREQQAAVSAGLHLAEGLPVVFEGDSDRSLGHGAPTGGCRSPR